MGRGCYNPLATVTSKDLNFPTQSVFHMMLTKAMFISLHSINQ